MKENIKLHVIELFKRHQINDTNLEKELISKLEEKYEEILKETDNEITSFNKAISLIGDIEQIKSERKVIIKELKKDLSYDDKKKIKKFSKISFIFTCIIYLIYSLISKSWLTSWLIFGLYLIINQIYRVHLTDSPKKRIKIINYFVNGFATFILLFVISFGAFMSNYDNSFELNDNTLQKSVVIKENINELEINLIKANLTLKVHNQENIIVNQYAKNDLPEKYLFNSSINENKLLVKEEKTSFLLSKYYTTIYEVILPQNKLNKIDLYGISSDFNLDIDGSLSNITVESTSGNITSFNHLIIEEKAEFKVLKGNIKLENINAHELICSSTSGMIEIKNSFVDKGEISSLGGVINIEESNSNNLILTSNSGNIYLTKQSGKFDVSSKNGIIYLSEIKPTYESIIKTENGNIYYYFTKNREYNLEVKSENGVIDSEYYDDLEGVKVNITSINGNIIIYND